ncbi:hypothetical protein ACFXHD_24895 [Streptomyces hydrogenans]|uniref:hypothetical protein n=1 Tax=Streptomyces hydrogenans TaxID=1873719 RepID=UPI0036C27232
MSIALRDETGDTGPANENGAAIAASAESAFRWKAAEVTIWHTQKLSEPVPA